MFKYEYILNKIKQETPDEAFYIVNLSKVEEAYNRWTFNLPNVQPYYAMKCNPNPKVLSILYKMGCNFDCASKSEMEQIMKISDDASRILFAHPCKYPSHLEYAKKNNIKLMTFDSEEELYKIKEYYPNAELLLRLAVDDSQSLCKFNIKFGCKNENIMNILKKAKDYDLNIVGFSFHVGSGCRSANTYYDALERCNNARCQAEELGYNIKIIDIGGGFTSCITNDIPTFEEMAIKINEGIKDFYSNTEIKFIAEPGRFMVQESHTLVLCVISKKKDEDKFIYYLNDGIYGSFNCIIFDHQHPEIIPIKNYSPDEIQYSSQIFGNTCDSIDEIVNNVKLPELFINDYVYVNNFGAYTISAKSDGFNGFKVKKFSYVY